MIVLHTQNIRKDFVSGVLSEEELGNQLYVHMLQVRWRHACVQWCTCMCLCTMAYPHAHNAYTHTMLQGGEYAAWVHSIRSYDSVSTDVMQRWNYPFIPECNTVPMREGRGAFQAFRGNMTRYVGYIIILSAAALVSSTYACLFKYSHLVSLEWWGAFPVFGGVTLGNVDEHEIREKKGKNMKNM